MSSLKSFSPNWFEEKLYSSNKVPRRAFSKKKKKKQKKKIPKRIRNRNQEEILAYQFRCLNLNRCHLSYEKHNSLIEMIVMLKL